MHAPRARARCRSTPCCTNSWLARAEPTRTRTGRHHRRITRHHGGDAAVAYKTSDGHLAVAGWRFATPGGGGAARTVLASKAGAELPTQIRLTTLVQSDENDPIPLVTLSRIPSGQLRLVGWRLKKTLVFFPSGPIPLATAAKPS